MKTKIKTHAKNTIIYLTSSSILFNSCEGTFDYGITKDHFAVDGEVQTDLLPLNIYLDENEIKYLKLIETFAIDALTKQEISEQFNKNPRLVLEKYGLQDLKIDLNKDEFQFIKALGDNDVMQTLKEGDFCEFWKVLEEKGLFNNERTEILKTIKSKFDFVDSSTVRYRSESNDILSEDESRFAVILAVLAIIYVAVGTIAAVELAVYIHAAVHQYTATSGIQSKINESNDLQLKSTSATTFYLDQILNGSIMNLWKNNSIRPETYDATDSRINTINEILGEAKQQGVISQRQYADGLSYAKGIFNNQ